MSGIGDFFGGFFKGSNDASSDNQAVGWVSQIHQRNAFLEDFGVAPSDSRLQAGRELGQSIVTGTEILADITGVNTATILGSGKTVTGQNPTALDTLAVLPAGVLVKSSGSVAKSLVRNNLPSLPKAFAKAFEEPIRIKTFKAGNKLYRSPWEPDEKISHPGVWFGTRRTSTQIGTDSMYKITKWGNPNTSLSTFELIQDTTLYYGKVKGGTGYQVLFPKDVNPRDVLKFIRKTPLK